MRHPLGARSSHTALFGPLLRRRPEGVARRGSAPPRCFLCDSCSFLCRPHSGATAPLVQSRDLRVAPRARRWRHNG
eukprot:6604001-Alexandrium_andersonii.AAC.1